MPQRNNEPPSESDIKVCQAQQDAYMARLDLDRINGVLRDLRTNGVVMDTIAASYRRTIDAQRLDIERLRNELEASEEARSALAVIGGK